MATLRVELLEARDTPALALALEYAPTFTFGPEARATLDALAADLGAALTGPPLTVAVEAVEYPGPELARGGPTGPGRGVLLFDLTQSWHFGATTAGLGADEFDFHSVALHELGHALGVGTSAAWASRVRGGAFHGAHAVAAYGGPVPVSDDGAHWAAGIPAVFGPAIAAGRRLALTPLDAAGLRDIGYGVDLGALVEPIPAPASPFLGYAGRVNWTAADVTGDGIADHIANPAFGSSHVKVFDGATGAEVRSFLAFDGFAGAVAVAAADLDRDGRAELVLLAAAPAPHLKVFAGDDLVVSLIAPAA